jgi:hypothetical protein
MDRCIIYSADEVENILFLIAEEYGVGAIYGDIDYLIELIELEFDQRPPQYLIYNVLSTTVLF